MFLSSTDEDICKSYAVGALEAGTWDYLTVDLRPDHPKILVGLSSVFSSL